ncbi:MAG: ABC transporter permease [Verrucomicrobiales bacterium]
MSIWRLIGKELLHRKTALVLGLLSITTAMTAWIGAVSLMKANDLETDRLLAERERATGEEMQRLEDDYRKIMRELGYNVLILPKGQDLSRLRALGHPDTTMPYENAERLAKGGIETLNHLLPVLQQRVEWPEHGLEIILSGTPGQIPVAHKKKFLTPDGSAYRNPIMETLAGDELILGHSVAQTLGLEAGDETVLRDRAFQVKKVNPAEGTSDDIAVWARLDWVQEQLGMDGRINLILALECVCSAESLGIITAEVNGLVPDVQVMEFSSRVKARALARNRAEEAHREALEAEREHRTEITGAQQRFASVLSPLVVGGAVVWMFFLFLGNVRERRVEIGILRAIGTAESTLLAAFLLKSVAFGLLGAVVGFFLGHLLAAAWAGITLFSGDFWALLDFRLLAAALIAAPALCALAAWCAALPAIRKDPARILCEA